MLILRSLLFNIAFYINMVLWMFGLLPLMLGRRMWMIRGVQAWARSNFWLQRVITGTRVEFRGLERIPAGGMIVASKHHSLWETFALLPLFNDPAFVLKRELALIPFFGWFTWKGGMIALNRKGGAAALVDLNRKAAVAVGAGRALIIFPEGTRRAPGAAPSYKLGITHLYARLKVPCLPVALNSGLFWPRRRFLRRPGTIVVEILDPIPPGMKRDAFFTELQVRIETASDRLLVEGGFERGAADPEA